MERSRAAGDGGGRSSTVNSAVRFTFTVLLVGGSFSFFFSSSSLPDSLLVSDAVALDSELLDSEEPLCKE